MNQALFLDTQFCLAPFTLAQALWAPTHKSYASYGVAQHIKQ
jgi:hypothetical protein